MGESRRHVGGASDGNPICGGDGARNPTVCFENFLINKTGKCSTHGTPNFVMVKFRGSVSDVAAAA